MPPAEYGAAMADVLEMEPAGDPDEDSQLSAADQAFLDDCTLPRVMDPEQNDKIFEINAGAREFMELILFHVSACADRSAALRAVRQAKMWANSGIARKGRC
jgi:hypothetical protein